MLGKRATSAQDVAQRQKVAFRAQPRDHPFCRRGGLGLGAPALLARVDVADVDLHDGCRASQQGVQDRDGIGVAGGVDHDAVRVSGRLDLIDQAPFAVGLVEFQRHARGLAQVQARALDVRQGRGSVNLGLPLSEEIEVRPVQNVDCRRLATFGSRTRLRQDALPLLKCQ